MQKLGFDGKIDVDARQDASITVIGLSMQGVDSLGAAEFRRVFDFHKDDLVGNVCQSRGFGKVFAKFFKFGRPKGGLVKGEACHQETNGYLGAKYSRPKLLDGMSQLVGESHELVILSRDGDRNVQLLIQKGTVVVVWKMQRRSVDHPPKDRPRLADGSVPGSVALATGNALEEFQIFVASQGRLGVGRRLFAALAEPAGGLLFDAFVFLLVGIGYLNTIVGTQPCGFFKDKRSHLDLFHAVGIVDQLAGFGPGSYHDSRSGALSTGTTYDRLFVIVVIVIAGTLLVEAVGRFVFFPYSKIVDGLPVESNNGEQPRDQ